jgi:hypothetical protein
MKSGNKDFIVLLPETNTLQVINEIDKFYYRTKSFIAELLRKGAFPSSMFVKSLKLDEKLAKFEVYC